MNEDSKIVALEAVINDFCIFFNIPRPFRKIAVEYLHKNRKECLKFYENVKSKLI